VCVCIHVFCGQIVYFTMRTYKRNKADCLFIAPHDILLGQVEKKYTHLPSKGIYNLSWNRIFIKIIRVISVCVCVCPVNDCRRLTRINMNSVSRVTVPSIDVVRSTRKSSQTRLFARVNLISFVWNNRIPVYRRNVRVVATDRYGGNPSVRAYFVA